MKKTYKAPALELLLCKEALCASINVSEWSSDDLIQDEE